MSTTDDPTMQLPASAPRVEKLMLRPAEVAAALSIGRTTCYALIASGEIPSRKIGRSLRVSTAALKAWAEARDGSAGVQLKRVG